MEVGQIVSARCRVSVACRHVPPASLVLRKPFLVETIVEKSGSGHFVCGSFPKHRSFKKTGSVSPGFCWFPEKIRIPGKNGEVEGTPRTLAGNLQLAPRVPASRPPP